MDSACIIRLIAFERFVSPSASAFTRHSSRCFIRLVVSSELNFFSRFVASKRRIFASALSTFGIPFQPRRFESMRSERVVLLLLCKYFFQKRHSRSEICKADDQSFPFGFLPALSSDLRSILRTSLSNNANFCPTLSVGPMDAAASSIA